MKPLVRWALVSVLMAVPLGASAQTVSVTGTETRLTSDPAAQIDPAISGDLVVFTDLRNGNEDVYYVDIATGAEVQVTSSPQSQRLQDVSDGVIVYTDYASGLPDVYGYDAASGTTFPVHAGDLAQENPAIDARRVAYEQADGAGGRDIWVADLDTGAQQAITSTPEIESAPAVSGNRVVFERSASAFGQADIVLYDLSTGAETVLASSAADERHPDIDGDLVVWDAIPEGGTDKDVFIHDLATGTTTRLALPGNQQIPHVSGQVVAFDDDSQGNPDVVLYHVPTGYVHRFTAPTSSEFLNDIDGNRVVFTSDASGNLDIWLYEFTVTVDGGECTPPPDPATIDACALADDDDGCDATASEESAPLPDGLTRVYATEHEREKGKPATWTEHFAADAGTVGVAAIRSEHCASATVSLNGTALVVPDDLDAHPACLSVPVSFDADNTLELSIASKPGCELGVKLYALPPPPTCEPPPEVGCESGPGPAGLLALLLVLFGLGLRPRPERVRVRRR